MTEGGRTWVLHRIAECVTMESLRKFWDGLAYDYRRDPVIRAAKDRQKWKLGR